MLLRHFHFGMINMLWLTWLSGGVAHADVFGTGPDQFTIDFVTISGATNPDSGFGIVDHHYRIALFEVTNAQFDKFKAAYGPVTGNPTAAYDDDSYWTGDALPTQNVSWYEAAQFANWLNTSTGHQPAYKFTGTQGTSDYTLSTWSDAEAAAGTRNYRHKDAVYFLPTEDEWVKAAYWNGSEIQLYATPSGIPPTIAADANYNWAVGQPWAVGSGSMELNGTYDMMGNVWEWMESLYADHSTSLRTIRGGGYGESSVYLRSSYRSNFGHGTEYVDFGFRVASVPEPSVLASFAPALLLLIRRRTPEFRQT